MLKKKPEFGKYFTQLEVKQPRLSPGSVLRRQEVKKSAVKWMSTSQKKSRTLWLRLQALAPTSKPRPRENSSFSWISVKLLNRVSLRERRRQGLMQTQSHQAVALLQHN